MKLDEEQLVEGCRRLDEKACKQFYDRYAANMMSLCLRYTGSHSEAQDVLHDGFMTIFAKIKTLRSVDSLDSWVRRIMVNTAIDHIRARHALESIDEIDDNIPANESYNLYDTERIMQAIAKLPSAMRTVFNLFEIEGYSHREIAKQLNYSETAVRTLLFRAKKKLAQSLDIKEQRISY